MLCVKLFSSSSYLKKGISKTLTILYFSLKASPDITRVELEKTITALLVQLADVKQKISSSPVDPSKKTPFILAITGTEKLLELLKSVLSDSNLGPIVSYILETKDTIQNIVYEWNAASSDYSSKKICLKLSSLFLFFIFKKATTSPTGSTSPTTISTLPPDDFNKILDSLEKQLNGVKDSLSLLALNNVQVEEQERQNAALLMDLEELRQEALSIDPFLAAQQLSYITEDTKKLESEVTSLLNANSSEFFFLVKIAF